MWLRQLSPLLASLAALTCHSACTPPYLDPKGREFQLPFVLKSREEMVTLTGRQEFGEMWSMAEFSDPLRFSKLNQTVDATAYCTVTFGDSGEAYLGRYLARATLRKSEPSGSAGHASSELYVEETDLRLVERRLPPRAPLGVKGILPGQEIVRRIPDGTLPGLDDRYLIELPADKPISLWFYPWSDEYLFALGITQDGVSIPIESDGKSAARRLKTTSAGLYEFRVRAGSGKKGIPDGYAFSMAWGDSRSGGPLKTHDIKFK